MPSRKCAVIAISGDNWRNAASASGRPAMTPDLRAASTARPWVSSGIVAIEVMSPARPKSSSSARVTAASISSGDKKASARSSDIVTISIGLEIHNDYGPLWQTHALIGGPAMQPVIDATAIFVWAAVDDALCCRAFRILLLPGDMTENSKLAVSWRTPSLIIGAGCLIALMSFGPRSSLGFFLTPLSNTNHWGRDVFAFALALQNLLWGIGQPLAGMIADRFGTGRVLCAGALMYAAGLALMAHTHSAPLLDVSAGVLIGFGLSGSSFMVLLATFGKLLPPE